MNPMRNDWVTGQTIQCVNLLQYPVHAWGARALGAMHGSRIRVNGRNVWHLVRGCLVLGWLTLPIPWRSKIPLLALKRARRGTLWSNMHHYTVLHKSASLEQKHTRSAWVLLCWHIAFLPRTMCWM